MATVPLSPFLYLIKVNILICIWSISKRMFISPKEVHSRCFQNGCQNLVILLKKDQGVGDSNKGRSPHVER